MLVTNGMPKFDTTTNNLFRCFRCNLFQFDDQYRFQCDTYHDGHFPLRVIFEYIPIFDLTVTLQSDGIFLSVRTFSNEATFLSRPLIQLQVFDFCVF